MIEVSEEVLKDCPNIKANIIRILNGEKITDSRRKFRFTGTMVIEFDVIGRGETEQEAKKEAIFWLQTGEFGPYQYPQIIGEPKVKSIELLEDN